MKLRCAIAGACLAACGGAGEGTACPEGEIADLEGHCVPDLSAVEHGTCVSDRSAAPEGRYIGYYGADPGTFEPIPPERGVYLDGGEFEVPPGEERTLCSYFVIERDVPLVLGRYQARMRPGSHHFNFFQIGRHHLDDVELGAPRPCLDTLPESYLAGSQWEYVDAPMPDGLGRRIADGIAVEMQMHYINTGTEPIVARVEINLYHRPPEQVEHYIGLYFNVMHGFEIPPGEARSFRARREAEPGVSVMLLTSHMHRFGRRFAIGVAGAGSDDIDWVYQSFDYDRPVICQRAWDPLVIGERQDLVWQCDYRNDTDRPVREGLMGLTDEMCIMAAFYYDDVGLFPFGRVAATEVDPPGDLPSP